MNTDTQSFYNQDEQFNTTPQTNYEDNNNDYGDGGSDQRLPTPPPVSAQNALQAYLASLQKQSLVLDSKIEKEDDITPSANVYVDISSASVAALKDTESTVSGSASSVSLAASDSSQIRQKNDSFFNDILGKSEDLIAQTQSKLDRLAKLETVVKPLGPILSSTPVVQKVRPQPSPVPGKSDAPAPPPPPPTRSNDSHLSQSQAGAAMPKSNSFSLIGFVDGSNQQSNTGSTSQTPTTHNEVRNFFRSKLNIKKKNYAENVKL